MAESLKPFASRHLSDGLRPLPMPHQNPVAERLREIHRRQSALTSSPWSHDLIDLALAVATSLTVSEDGPPVWMLFIGSPSSGKTDTVLTLKEAAGVYFVDMVTENFLGSGYRDPRTGARAPDVLKDLDGKCFIIKDLTPIFSLRHEKVRKFLGDLQALYDGEYTKLTGTVGRTGGHARVTVLACVTPDSLHTHQHYMAEIGSRFLFYRIPPLSREEQERGIRLLRSSTRKDDARQWRALVAEHVEALRRAPVVVADDPPEVFHRLADLLARGRGLVRRDQGGEIVSCQVEEPMRAFQQLWTLARSLARVRGDSLVTCQTIELVRRVVVSSIPEARSAVLSRCAEHAEGLTAKGCGDALQPTRSESNTRQLLDELAQLGLVAEGAAPSEGCRPPARYRVVERFADLFDDMVLRPYLHHPIE